MELMLLDENVKNKNRYFIYILLTDTNSSFSKVEKWFLNTSFSHASISFDGTLRDVYAFNDDGFVKEDLQKCDLLRNADYSLYTLELTREEWMRGVEAMKEFLDNPKKYKYSNEGLIRLILGKPKEYNHKFFCSEFVAHIINSVDSKYMNNEHRGMVSPEDLARNRNFKLIDKGKNLGSKYPK